MASSLIQIFMKAIFAITVFFGSGGRCMLVEEKVPDVMGKVSDVIAPHGCCAGYEADIDKLRYTR
jgi:hypothetical protein